jgi:hypothetical protein
MRGFRMPSPAMIVALIALASSLAGGAYAVTKLKRNSVHSKQIARNAVKSADIAPNAVKGVDVNEGTLGKVPDADKFGGVGATGYPRVFSGHTAIDPPDPDSAVLFSVPQLGVSVIADDTVASSGGIRVRNDRTTGQIKVAVRDDFDGVSEVVDPGEIEPSGSPGGSGIQNTDMPLTITTSAVPDSVLTVICGIGDGGEHCVGLLSSGG